MNKKPKKAVKFFAKLPVLVDKRRKVLKRDWLNWPADRREHTQPAGYITLETVPNPCIKRLRKMLTKQRVNFTEENDGSYVTFNTQ